jgi:hypothetical protein
MQARGRLVPTCCSLLLLLPGLLEIRAVALQTVAIKDVNSVRYLCMDEDGKMRGLVSVPTRRGCTGLSQGFSPPLPRPD